LVSIEATSPTASSLEATPVGAEEGGLGEGMEGGLEEGPGGEEVEENVSEGHAVLPPSLVDVAAAAQRQHDERLSRLIWLPRV
jgi:hypothetical protein